MRALLVPSEGELVVLEAPTWSEHDIATALGVADAPHPRYHASIVTQPGAHGRPYATLRRTIFASRYLSLAQARPVLVFGTDRIGMISGLARREVLHLGLLFAVEEALLAIADGTYRRELT